MPGGRKDHLDGRPAVLLCEGRDLKSVMHRLFTFMKANGTGDPAASTQIVDFEGIDQLTRKLELLVGDESWNRVRAVGIVRDAEEGPAQDALKSVANSLVKVLGGPPALSPATWIRFKEILFSAFILPDCASPGMLETLCNAALVTASLDKTDCVDTFLECLGRQGLVRAKEKVRLYSLVAAFGYPGLKIGEAAACDFWPWSSEVFGPLRQFVAALEAAGASRGESAV